jgi:hypothetical protein
MGEVLTPGARSSAPRMRDIEVIDAAFRLAGHRAAHGLFRGANRGYLLDGTNSAGARSDLHRQNQIDPARV